MMNNIINYIWFFTTAIITLGALVVILTGLLFMLGGL